MRGTPYWFAGDEIGMRNIRFDRIEDYNDIDTINRYKKAKAEGKDPQAVLDEQKETGRDNARTPFQWDRSPETGFTAGTPWLKVNPDYTWINVADEEKDPTSILNYFKKVVSFRKENPSSYDFGPRNCPIGRVRYSYLSPEWRLPPWGRN